jgi:predicted O-methyltransferase YrrM
LLQAALSIKNADERARRKDVPRVELSPEHVANCRLLVSRLHLADLLPNGAIVAELGVFRGDFSAEILARSSPRTLHLVDMWGGAAGAANLAHVTDRFRAQADAGQVVITQAKSVDALAAFPDGHCDWLYIDTDHTYATTALELELARRKIKPGGIIAGHDYVLGSWETGVRYGVIEAVHEFCHRERFELVYLTNELGQHRTFALRAMAGG